MLGVLVGGGAPLTLPNTRGLTVGGYVGDDGVSCTMQLSDEGRRAACSCSTSNGGCRYSQRGRKHMPRSQSLQESGGV